jgi:sporulation protein YlmC with PRC-barrel domain
MAETLLFFTELLSMPVFDIKGRRIGRVKDAALVPLLHPSRIDRFLVGGADSWLTFRHDQVRSVSLKGIYLSDELLVPYHDDEYMMRIGRDLLDQQIIDVTGRKVVRVNDVDLSELRANNHVELRIAQVDVGLPGAVRRLLQGLAPSSMVRRLQTRLPQRSIRWEFVNLIEPDPLRRVKLRRTVRIGLWGGEEEGLLGSREYVKAHFGDPATMALKPEHAKLAGYFNVDNGTGLIRGVYLQGNEAVAPIFSAWMEPFKNLGMNTLTIRNTGGTDHLSYDAVGLPGFQFIQDPVEYQTRTHHTNMDVYDRLQRTDLMQASAIMASFVYHAAMRDEMLPRKPLPPPQPRSGTIPDVTFTKAGDQTLTLDAYVPEGTGPFPAAILVHGGGFARGERNCR